jgi:hypothetical protein
MFAVAFFVGNATALVGTAAALGDSPTVTSSARAQRPQAALNAHNDTARRSNRHGWDSCRGGHPADGVHFRIARGVGAQSRRATAPARSGARRTGGGRSRRLNVRPWNLGRQGVRVTLQRTREVPSLYDRPMFYELLHGGRSFDLDHYAGVAAGKRSPVLDVGAGTGRVALELARRGVAVVALEREPRMVERVAHRLNREPESTRELVQIVAADVREYEPEAKHARTVRAQRTGAPARRGGAPQLLRRGWSRARRRRPLLLRRPRPESETPFGTRRLRTLVS